MSERTDDPTFKYYDYDAAQNDNFSFGGHMYYTTNDGKMFLAPQGELNQPVEIDTNQAIGIRGQLAQDRANREYINNLDYTQDGSIGMDARGEEKISEDFAKGFFAMPEGDNPYQGHSASYQFGRFAGKFTPAWDDGRQAAVTGYDIGQKYYNGQPVERHDYFKFAEHAGKAGLELGGAKILNGGIKLLRRP